jgi:hypothetical protein
VIAFGVSSAFAIHFKENFILLVILFVARESKCEILLVCLLSKPQLQKLE